MFFCPNEFCGVKPETFGSESVEQVVSEWNDRSPASTSNTKPTSSTVVQHAIDENTHGLLHKVNPCSCGAHIHTVEELVKQIIMGRSLSCLARWIAQHVDVVICPDCGKHALPRERRMVCTGCDSVYPADKWANGEPCDCGCRDARYHGIHYANGLGQLDFQQCETPGCRWGREYRRLTVQELADAVESVVDEQYETARVCPECSAEANGIEQRNGVYLPIESCDCCGWQLQETEDDADKTAIAAAKKWQKLVDTADASNKLQVLVDARELTDAGVKKLQELAGQ